jgi:hypothetical protein
MHATEKRDAERPEERPAKPRQQIIVSFPAIGLQS